MRGIWVTGLLVLLGIPVFAQTSGEITGEVKDATGAVVSGASVTATNQATNATRTAVSNEAGVYDFPAMQPGTYTMRVEKPGFKTVTQSNIELQVQQTARLDFALEVGQVNETVEVSASAALLTTENATVGTVIENRRIVDLPLNGRNFLQLVALSPNVTTAFANGGQAGSRQGGDRSQQQISVSGQRREFNYFTLDGIDNTDVNFRSDHGLRQRRTGGLAAGRRSLTATDIGFRPAPRVQLFHAGWDRQHGRQLQHLHFPALHRRAAGVQGADGHVFGRIRARGEPGQRFDQERHQPVSRGAVRISAQQRAGRAALRLYQQGARQGSFQVEPVRVYAGRAGGDSQAVPRQRPAVLHVEFRRVPAAQPVAGYLQPAFGAHAGREFFGTAAQDDDQRSAGERALRRQPDSQGAVEWHGAEAAGVLPGTKHLRRGPEPELPGAGQQLHGQGPVHATHRLCRKRQIKLVRPL